MECRTLSKQYQSKYASNRVDDTLSASNAQRRNICELPGGVSFSHWFNHRDHINYQNLNHHTLSIYLQGGGAKVRRCDLPQLKGEPGSICLFPVGHDSQWEVGNYVEFVHLYFSDDALRRLALTALDIDPRRVELPDLTYVDDPQLVHMLHREVLPLHWQDHSDRLALQQSSEAMLLHLLRQYVHLGSTQEIFRGGLSRMVRNRVTDYMHHHLEQPLSIEELAAVAQLSPFHFSRMFRVSMACTPHQYLTGLRIERAQRLLALPPGGGESLTLATIALQCGFSNQSHFGRVFKQQVGVTPVQYRVAMSVG